MKRILIVVEDDTDVLVLSHSSIHHSNMVGRRFDRAIVDDSLDLTDEEEAEIYSCQVKDDPYFIWAMYKWNESDGKL